jgi:transcriptional regulator with XRE-family HTH domain
MTIGQKIKYIRSLRGLTQSELGTMLGFTDSFAKQRISQYESGYRIPKGKAILTLANALGVSESFFVNHHMETEECIVQLLFDLERTCSMELVQIDKKNDIYGISFKDDIINEVLKEWCEKQKLMKSGEISETDYALWQAKFSTKE